MDFNLGFIGGGNMSTAIVNGILKSGGHPASKIWVAGPHIERLKTWNDLGTNTTTKNGEVVNNCDVIFLGVKPNQLIDAVKSIPKDLSVENANKKVLFISMLAGINLNDLHKTLKLYLNNDSTSVIRIMPNTPMMVGAGACIYTPDPSVTDQQCALLEKLLSPSGICERVPENMIDSLGSLAGCGPAFMYVVIEALADGAVKQGVPRAMALRYAAQVLVGSGQMVLQTGIHPGLLKDEVCSPGGTTICGINAIENGNLRATMMNAVEAATLRTKQLKQ